MESMAIDEVSKTLGSFESLLKTHGDTLLVIQDGIKEIRNYQIAQNGKVDKLHGRVDDIEPVLEKAAEQGNDWQDTKSKAKWVIGLGFLGSASGGFSLSKILGNFFT